MVNKYTTNFFAICPVNKIRIEYELVIESTNLILVEELLSTVSSVDFCLHEKIADDLFNKYGGRQTLKAFHHGVLIETLRGDYELPEMPRQNEGA